MIRLYKAVCGWLEASTRLMEVPDEVYPEGAGEARSEHAHSYSQPPEMHITSNRQSLDDDDGGVYKTSTIGFRRREDRA